MPCMRPDHCSCWLQVFIWVGRNSTETEKAAADALAKKYLATLGRSQTATKVLH